ncbi:MAG: tetraacyldisaccharide 4'-kinase [Tepidimonas ignava]|nr:tetraacyldisaccharide 4'-kinase [Tepidimonas ignava]
MAAIDWTRLWQHRRPALCLYPLAWLYGVLLGVRRWLWRRGWCRPWRAPVPVLVVGNVVVGGAGKTPTTATLVQHLRQRGWRPGIVARGYGAPAGGAQTRLVAEDPDPARCGDEPVLLARATGVPVAVGRDRVAAVRRLLQRHPEVDIIVADDGLQHWRLAADAAVVVFDARDVGNGWLLPAGPLREPWPLRRPPAPTVWVLRTEPSTRPPTAHPYPEFAAQRRLVSAAVALDGTRRPLAHWRSAGQAVGALAGIARPEAFFAALRSHGVPLAATVPLADHAPAESIRAALHAALAADGPRQWLCTEKDAIKLRPADLPPGVTLWAVPLEVAPSPAWFEALDAWLATVRQPAPGAL